MNKNAAALPCALLLALTLSACGGGGGGGSDSATGGASATAGGTSAAAATAAPASTAVASDSSDNIAAPSPSAPSTSTPATDTAATPPADSTGSPSEPKIVEYYGDSTVWGYRTNTGGQVDKPAPVAFAESLPNPSRYDVRNEGVSATTACDLLNGSDGRHPAWSTQMANSKADYVLVNHAINDQWRYDVATYKSCLTGLAQGAKQHGKTMIFETPNPTRDSGSWGLDVYVNAMKEVAAQQNVPVIDQYAYLTDYLAGQSPYTICPDGLHPTQEVYILKGQYAAGAFSRLFN